MIGLRGPPGLGVASRGIGVFFCVLGCIFLLRAVAMEGDVCTISMFTIFSSSELLLSLRLYHEQHYLAKESTLGEKSMIDFRKCQQEGFCGARFFLGLCFLTARKVGGARLTSEGRGCCDGSH